MVLFSGATMLARGVVLALFSASTASAFGPLNFDGVSFPQTVRADTDAALAISNQFDEGFRQFRIYLSVSPPGWGSNPVCWLVNATDATQSTQVAVRIPASVGPDAGNYSIVVSGIDPGPSGGGGGMSPGGMSPGGLSSGGLSSGVASFSGYMYSQGFSLVGGTGSYSQFETDPSGPWSLGPQDQIPCSAYDCVRGCNQQFYPGSMPGSEDGCAARSAYECAARCPGVEYPALDDTDSNYTCSSGNGSDSSSGGGSSSDSPATATATIPIKAATRTGGFSRQTSSSVVGGARPTGATSAPSGNDDSAAVPSSPPSSSSFSGAAAAAPTETKGGAAAASLGSVSRAVLVGGLVAGVWLVG